MSRRRNPFKEIEEMMNRMSKQFEESVGGSDLGQLTGGDGSTSIDLADHGDEFLVTADLPGFHKDDIDLTLRGDQLQIHAERSEESEEVSGEDEGGEEYQYIRKERHHQSVSRSVTIPEEVDEESVSAQYHNGVLTVTLPKMRAETEESHEIDIS